jgi:hypothetical protein
MVPEKLKRIFVLSIIGISLFSCKIEEVIVNGDIEGLVTDAANSQPIQAAKIKLIPSYDTPVREMMGHTFLKILLPEIMRFRLQKMVMLRVKKM